MNLSNMFFFSFCFLVYFFTWIEPHRFQVRQFQHACASRDRLMFKLNSNACVKLNMVWKYSCQIYVTTHDFQTQGLNNSPTVWPVLCAYTFCETQHRSFISLAKLSILIQKKHWHLEDLTSRQSFIRQRFKFQIMWCILYVTMRPKFAQVIYSVVLGLMVWSITWTLSIIKLFAWIAV